MPAWLVYFSKRKVWPACFNTIVVAAAMEGRNCKDALIEIETNPTSLGMKARGGCFLRGTVNLGPGIPTPATQPMPVLEEPPRARGAHPTHADALHRRQ